MEKTSSNKIKIILFLFMVIFLFSIYCITVPVENIHYKSYTLHFFNILYSFIILVCIVIMQFQDYSKKDWVIALVLGGVSVFVTIPINVSGVISGICVVVAFLASKTLYGKYNQRMDLFNARTLREFFCDVKWSLIISFLFLVIKLISIYISSKSIQLEFQLSMLGRALGAAISEEIIFRLFFFSVLVNIGKEQGVSKKLAVIVMLLPFGLLHVVDIGVNNSILMAFLISMNYWLVTFILIILAFKRNVFSSIIVHFLIDIIAFSVLVR